MCVCVNAYCQWYNWSVNSDVFHVWFVQMVVEHLQFTTKSCFCMTKIKQIYTSALPQSSGSPVDYKMATLKGQNGIGFTFEIQDACRSSANWSNNYLKPFCTESKNTMFIITLRPISSHTTAFMNICIGIQLYLFAERNLAPLNSNPVL